MKSISRAWHSALKKAGITRRIRPYDLRHAFASNLLAEHADYKSVAELMWHDVAMLLRTYQHIDRQQKRQAVEKILQTERYRFVIYDWNYGMELDDLIGKNASFVIPELKRRIEDALLADDRVTAGTGFHFSQERDSVAADFLVHTIFGELRAERTVDI